MSEITSIQLSQSTRKKLATYRLANDFKNYDQAILKLIEIAKNKEV